ncbi:hypothetical protein [Streptomyces azureus]|uniref:hypothetical protein n=1 Tax=Streptomyces azureus TaxID=146537 RepID=UPI003C2EE498
MRAEPSLLLELAGLIVAHAFWSGLTPTDARRRLGGLSDLPDDTPVTELVRLAKIRWRIEHDYREPKHGPGLDHFEA